MLKTIIRGTLDRLVILAFIALLAWVIAGILHDVSVASCGEVCR